MARKLTAVEARQVAEFIASNPQAFKDWNGGYEAAGHASSYLGSALWAAGLKSNVIDEVLCMEEMRYLDALIYQARKKK